MNPFDLSPSDPAVLRIREAARRGTLSHALLFTGSGARSAARCAAAAMECQGAADKPCGVCPACRKVLADIHPDVTTVRDPEHKNIAVEVIRSIRADAYIRPNEGQRKVYLFPDCALLTEADQNILLKVVEEGPPYAAFLFCADSAGQVLQTLRSRCVELMTRPAETAETAPAAGAEEGAALLLEALLERRRGAAAEAAVELERRKLSREDLAAVLERCRAVLSSALLLLYGGQIPEEDRKTALSAAKTLTKVQIMGTIELLQKYHGDCAYNVGAGHVLGALAVELEGIL
ncbi:DNA polymerase III subunit delta' [Dysosmobacter sp. Phy]